MSWNLFAAKIRYISITICQKRVSSSVVFWDWNNKSQKYKQCVLIELNKLYKIPTFYLNLKYSTKHWSNCITVLRS